mgnify:FL=1
MDIFRKSFCWGLVFGVLFAGCAGPSRMLMAGSSDAVSGRKITCHYPIEPSNMLSLLVFYKKAMRYLSFGEDACREPFADELRREVQTSFWVTKGCEAVTLEDIEDALYRPDVLNKRYKYFDSLPK